MPQQIVQGRWEEHSSNERCVSMNGEEGTRGCRQRTGRSDAASNTRHGRRDFAGVKVGSHSYQAVREPGQHVVAEVTLSIATPHSMSCPIIPGPSMLHHARARCLARVLWLHPLTCICGCLRGGRETWLVEQ